MITNHSKYYFLNSDGILHDKDNTCFSVANLRDWDDKSYWMIEFITSEAFKERTIEKIAGPDIFQDIMKGKITLLLVHISEAYHYVINDIYQEIIINQKIPAENILYITNSADIDLEIAAIANKYNLPKIESIHMMSYEYGAFISATRYSDLFCANTLSNKNYEKKFLSLNGLWRPHRMLLGSFLTGMKIIDKGFVSLNCVPYDLLEPEEMFKEMMRWCKDNPEGKKVLLKNHQIIKKIPRLYLDEVTLRRPEYTTLDKTYYENTYFSIVTETLAWKEQACGGITIGRALSEKTFKPILFKHPFLLIALPKALELLRELGYRTFSECIDESYDNEYDDSKRVYMVAKETERLCNLSKSELKDFLKVCREITNHNFEVLKNKQKFLYQKT